MAYGQNSLFIWDLKCFAYLKSLFFEYARAAYPWVNLRGTLFDPVKRKENDSDILACIQ